MCPGNNITGGKRNPAPPQGHRWLGETLNQCACAASHSQDCYLRAQYWRLTRRIGKKKAAMAVGHSILVICWHLLTNNCDYEDLGADWFTHQPTTTNAAATASSPSSKAWDTASASRRQPLDSSTESSHSVVPRTCSVGLVTAGLIGPWWRTGAPADGSRHGARVQSCGGASRPMSVPAAAPRWLRAPSPFSLVAWDGWPMTPVLV